MKRSGMFVLCFLGMGCFLHSEKHDCFCGTVADDVLFARAAFLFDASIRDTLFDVGDGAPFPQDADVFFPPWEKRQDVDDHYPLEGTIAWWTKTTRSWEAKAVLKSESEIKRYSAAGRVAIPIKAGREVEWFDDPNPTRKEKQVFNFNKNYGALLEAFRVLKKDVTLHYDKNACFLAARLQDIANHVPVYEWCGLGTCLAKRKSVLNLEKKNRELHLDRLRRIEQKETEAISLCAQSLDQCIALHKNPSAHVNRGFFYYLEGNNLDALNQIKQALEKLQDEVDLEKLKEEAQLLKGLSEIESGLYTDAVLTLTELIEKRPSNKEAYFERANAYFELGRFELSLQDYLASEIKPPNSSNTSPEMVAFTLGLTQGIVQGGAQAGLEFIPSLLASLHGLGHGLWAFAQDPVQVSFAFVQAAKACINFIQEHSSQDTLTLLVPELGELIKKWDQVGDKIRGEMTGLIIGKYGIDIFSGVGLTKAMQSYRELKKANHLLTFEAMAISDRNRSLIKLEAIRRAEVRKEIFKDANLKIQWDKQGKHIETHRNFPSTGTKSVLTHPDPQALVDEFAGTGTKAINEMPGSPGYQEIVNFKQFIGYCVERDTGQKIPTQWGKIHYAKDGVHIVPTTPR